MIPTFQPSALLPLLSLAFLAPPAHAAPRWFGHSPSVDHVARTGALAPRAADTTWTYVGCVLDSGTRTLAGASETNYVTMTPGVCATFCDSKGYVLSGTEWSGQCYCANAYTGTPTILAESQCSSVCGGDSSQKCGGSYRLSVYSKPATSSSTSTSRATSTSTSKAATSTSTTSKASTTTTSTTSTTSKATSTSTSSTTSKATSTSTTTSKASTTSTATSTTSSKASTTSATSTTSAVASSAVTGVAAPPAATGTKYLWAHHMVGNTYSYTQATWADDISQAAAAGIDGFALNMGGDSWQPARVADAYAAAVAQGTFKLFFSFDVTSISCSSTSDAANFATLISTYASSKAQATYQGKTLVSGFAGDACTFGQSSVLAGWTYVRSLLTAKGVSIYEMPAIFSDPSTFSSASMAWLDGELNWNSGWPMGATNLDTSSDVEYMADLGNKTYMPAVSPCFFTYYGPSSYNKNWIYRGDNWLLATRMEALIAMRAKFDMIELISWNDYGESHYVGPVRTDQPNSQGWTTGMPHTAWLSMVSIYAHAFKTGSYAAYTDGIWLWSRPHPKAATAVKPTNARPTNWDYTDDNVYALITLSSAATVVLHTGTHAATWNLPAGINKLSLGSAAGSIGANITRSGTLVKSYDSTGHFTYTTAPTDYNYNYFVWNV